MIQLQRARTRLNIHINRFVKKVITPVVLLAGLLLLLLFHFRGVLQTTQAQDDLFRGERSFSLGALQYTFHQNDGTDRPVVLANGLPILSWTEWSSTIAVDGHVSNLWDTFHGYDYDTASRQVFSTTSGTGWQVIQIVTLVNARTLRVDYQFVAQPDGIAVPRHIELAISHIRRWLYQPAISNNTLTAQILPGNVQDVSQPPPVVIATIALQVSGPQVPQGAIAIDDLRGTATAAGGQRLLATSFTTHYVIDNPVADKLTPLGTETLTFANALPAGVPIPATPSP